MAYGQPFWNYGANNYGAYNSGYVAPQPQPNYLYNQQPNMAQSGTQQPLSGVQGQQAQQPVQQAIIPPKTNMQLTTSLMDAMSRSSEPNTDFFYADQDNPYIYRISIDMQGRKTYKTFKIEDVTEQAVEQSGQTVTSSIDLSAYATKDDLKKFKEEITSYAMSFVKGQTMTGETPTPIVTAKPKTEKVAKKTEVVDTENKE